jgi:hypothetical protein
LIGGTEATGHEAEAKFAKKRNSTKSILRLPDLEHAKAVVLNSLNSADAFVDWCCSEPRLAFNRIVVLRYRSHLESRQLAPGTKQKFLDYGNPDIVKGKVADKPPETLGQALRRQEIRFLGSRRIHLPNKRYKMTPDLFLVFHISGQILCKKLLFVSEPPYQE